MAYKSDGKRYHCDRHDESFARTSTCPGCANDPGPPPDVEPDEQLPPPPPGCLSTVQLEALLVETAREIAALIELAADEGKGYDYHRANTLAKLYDTQLKYWNRALECARPREDEIVIKRREKRAAELTRGAGR